MMMLLRQWLVCLSVYYLSKGMAHTSCTVPLGNFVEVTLNQGQSLIGQNSLSRPYILYLAFSGKNLIHRVPFGKWCAIILSKMSRRFKTSVKNPCWNLIFLALSGSYLCLLVKDVQWRAIKFLGQKQDQSRSFFFPLYTILVRLYQKTAFR